MDFSLKQALGVVVVITVAALVVISAISLTKSNNDNATSSQAKLWEQASNQISGGE